MGAGGAMMGGGGGVMGGGSLQQHQQDEAKFNSLFPIGGFLTGKFVLFLPCNQLHATPASAIRLGCQGKAVSSMCDASCPVPNSAMFPTSL